MQRIFISHTTRDQRDYHLAHKIAQGLRSRGVKAWIAPDDIPAGADWEKELINTLLEQATHFLVILSAASIQSKWVQKEIKLAKKRKEKDDSFVIISLVTGELRDHPEKEFLERFQHIPYNENLRVIMDKLANPLGLKPAVPNQFGPKIDQLTKEFVGREYVFDAIQQFTKKHAQGYLLIEGDPGVGKSAILAEYVSRTGHPVHFNVQAEGINTARHFLESMCTQIIHRFDLPYPSLPNSAVKDSAFLSQILQEGANNLNPHEKLILVVDALDEVDQSSGQTGHNVLFLPSALPEQAYIILSARPIPLSLSTQTSFERYDLMQRVSESRQDVETFLQRSAGRPQVSRWIKKKNLNTDSFVQALADKSQNNFMYLKYVVGDIEQERYQDLSINELPMGLEKYYENHWTRMGMKTKPFPEDKINIVYVLSEIRQPVTRELIADFAQQKPLTVQVVLDDWSQFLQIHQVDGVMQYSLYHASFRDFLHRKDIVQSAGVTIKEINKKIADSLWDA